MTVYAGIGFPVVPLEGGPLDTLGWYMVGQTAYAGRVITDGFPALLSTYRLKKMPVFGGYLKQSTAKTVRIYVGIDGFQPRTGLVDANWITKSLAKAASVFSGVSPVITERAYGWYEVPLTSAHTDTLGELVLHLEDVQGDSVDVFWLVTVDGTEPTQVLAAVAGVQSDTDNLQGRIPAALISGRIDANVGAMDSTIIANAVLDAARSGHATLGSVGEGIALACGLLQGNFYMDNVTNTANGQIAARIRVFHDSVTTLAATAGGSGEGEFASFAVSTSYTGSNKIGDHRVVQL